MYASRRAQRRKLPIASVGHDPPPQAVVDTCLAILGRLRDGRRESAVAIARDVLALSYLVLVWGTIATQDVFTALQRRLDAPTTRAIADLKRSSIPDLYTIAKRRVAASTRALQASLQAPHLERDTQPERHGHRAGGGRESYRAGMGRGVRSQGGFARGYCFLSVLCFGRRGGDRVGMAPRQGCKC